MNVNAVGNAVQTLPKASLETQSAQLASAAAAAAQKPASVKEPEATSSGEPQKAELKASVEGINAFLKTFSNYIQFSIDEESGRTIVKLVDTETDTVLRQYPTKEALALARDIENFQGHLLKTEA